MLLYDVSLMSFANKIYGTHSSVARLATCLNSKSKQIDPHSFLLKNKDIIL
ncbi:hypothetical protein [Campylobacter novaezeelandiae]|uniref:hypothetical protein n=1 Tax=Campylobacter novaezeelandiae TaxID=2267891 RepID=UPI0014196F7D|nr:hypothetical protein [Campylobacter novaezeelandiae]